MFLTFWKVKYCTGGRRGGFDGRRPKSSNKHKQQQAATGTQEINCKIVLDILQKPPGFHTTAREPKRAQLAPTHQIPREDPQRERKKSQNGGGRGGKNANFLAPRIRVPTLRTPTLHCPPFERRPSGPPLFLGLGPYVPLFLVIFFFFENFTVFLFVCFSRIFFTFFIFSSLVSSWGRGVTTSSPSQKK